MVSTWWYWVSIGQHWLVLGGTGSVCGGTDWYLVELGHYVAVLAGTWWYWVSIGCSIGIGIGQTLPAKLSFRSLGL